MSTQQNVADLAGRVLISYVFLDSGIGKIAGYAGTQAYMEAAGVPGALLPFVIVLEVLGAVAIIVGIRTRLVAAALAGFTILSAVLFHGADDPTQRILFMKNFAVAEVPAHLGTCI